MSRRCAGRKRRIRPCSTSTSSTLLPPDSWTQCAIPREESSQAVRVDGTNVPGLAGSIRSRISRIEPGPPRAASAFASTSVPGSRTNVKTTTAIAAAATAPKASASREDGRRVPTWPRSRRGRTRMSSRSTSASPTSNRAGSVARSSTVTSAAMSPSGCSRPSSARASRAARTCSSRRDTDSRLFELRAQPAGGAEHQHLARADTPPRQPGHLRERVALYQPQMDDELVVVREARERAGQRLPFRKVAAGSGASAAADSTSSGESTSRPLFLSESAAMFAATR